MPERLGKKRSHRPLNRLGPEKRSRYLVSVKATTSTRVRKRLGTIPASQEYGINNKELTWAVRNLNKTARHEKTTKWDGTVKGLRALV